MVRKHQNAPQLKVGAPSASKSDIQHQSRRRCRPERSVGSDWECRSPEARGRRRPSEHPAEGSAQRDRRLSLGRKACLLLTLDGAALASAQQAHMSPTTLLEVPAVLARTCTPAEVRYSGLVPALTTSKGTAC